MSTVRVSDYYQLGVTQGGLDFVDIDVHGDVPVYIDPMAIRVQDGDWVAACQLSLQTFFSELLTAIKRDDTTRIGALIYPLSEPNETHLGQSKGKAKGRSLGSKKRADQLIAALRRSRAGKSGLLQDLEDTVLFVDGIGTDILSDIATCVIRRQLIAYTQNMCTFLEIPMEKQASDALWNTVTGEWDDDLVDLPRGPGGKLLFVPKSIVRIRPSLNTSEYYLGYLRPYFEDLELGKGLASEFVKLIRAGKKDERLEVIKGKLDEKLGTTKARVAQNSVGYPDAMQKYRGEKRLQAQVPMDSEKFADQTNTPTPNLQHMYEEILSIAPGFAGANPYHRAVAGLLTALFAGSLGNQNIETKLHDGLKRIDITYDNIAGDGLFRWFSLHYHSSVVPVECKNYAGAMGNPELDQLAMRFSPSRGEIGFLICRGIVDRERLLRRCRAAAADGHGYVIALDDADLLQLIIEFEQAQTLPFGDSKRMFPLLRERFDFLLGFDRSGLVLAAS